MTLVQASATRDAIRKNAYTLIRNRQDNTTIGWVKYVIWDYEYNDTEPYDTLIVKNGNLKINTNVTKNRGFIVLDEKFDGTKGNIYVGENVTDIEWILFGEGRLDSIGTKSTKQLRILWTVFTRNTIGGSILTSENKYTLPWGKMVNDTPENKNIAMSYDLNLLRAGKDWWNTPSVPPTIQFENASLVIRYNWENTANPPPWFSIIQ